MNIICIGIDYKKADIDFRSRVTFTESKYNSVYSKFKQCENILGVVILATCNRTEFYIHSEDSKEIESEIYEIIKDSFNLRDEDINRFYFLKSEFSLLHLFKVASGLESMVLGEDQILSQVKLAHTRAIELISSDRVLNKVFMEAIVCAKEVKSRTQISQNKLSISSISIELIENELGGLEGKKVLIVGMGEMSKLAVKNLCSKGVTSILLANRNLQKCHSIVRECKEVELIEFSKRYDVLSDVDAVISSTAAPHIIFECQKFSISSNGRQIVAVDMAVPRDMDDKIRNLSNVKLYDIDYFKLVAEQNASLRSKLSGDALYIIKEYVNKLIVWNEEGSIHNLLSLIDNYTDKHVSVNATSLMYKLELGDNPSRNEATEYALNLTNKTLKKIVLKLKSMPLDKSKEYATMLEELLG